MSDENHTRLAIAVFVANLAAYAVGLGLTAWYAKRKLDRFGIQNLPMPLRIAVQMFAPGDTDDSDADVENTSSSSSLFDTNSNDQTGSDFSIGTDDEDDASDAYSG